MPAIKSVKIGTRGSKLALIQAHTVKELIARNNPAADLEIVIIKTTGDCRQDVPLCHIGGKNLFLKEIERALENGSIDMAVHSMKDVPSDIPAIFEIAAILTREDPRDALITKTPLKSFSDLPADARVATCSLRRGSQLRHARPQLRILPIRGNQDTRLKKLAKEDIDAIVLAMAGIVRMEFKDLNLTPLETDECLPSGGQGSIGIEIRKNDRPIAELVQPLNDPDASVCVRAERAFLRRLGGDCHTPTAAFAEINDGHIHIRGLVADMEGQQVVRNHMRGDRNNPESVGSRLAENLLQNGAKEILANLDLNAIPRTCL